MNCEECKENLLEYLDGSLPAQAEGAFRQHFQECDGCRAALQREQAVAQRMEHSLQRATEGLSVRAETLAIVSRAWQAQQPAPGLLVLIRAWFVSRAIRPATAVALLLIGVLALLELPSYRQRATDCEVTYTLVVNVPIVTETRVFRRQGNLVVDALASGVTVGHARFVENKSMLKGK